MGRDFRSKVFQKVLRGYSPDEVDEYIAYINDEYHRLEKKNSENERKLVIALRKLDENNKLSEIGVNKPGEVPEEISKQSIRILDEARSKAEEIIAGAEKKAAAIIKAGEEEASAAAVGILSAAENEAAEAEERSKKAFDSAKAICDEVTAFTKSIYQLYDSHLASVDAIIEKSKDYLETVNSDYVSAESADVSCIDDAPDKADNDDIDIDVTEDETTENVIAEENDGESETDEIPEITAGRTDYEAEAESLVFSELMSELNKELSSEDSNEEDSEKAVADESDDKHDAPEAVGISLAQKFIAQYDIDSDDKNSEEAGSDEDFITGADEEKAAAEATEPESVPEEDLTIVSIPEEYDPTDFKTSEETNGNIEDDSNDFTDFEDFVLSEDGIAGLGSLLRSYRSKNLVNGNASDGDEDFDSDNTDSDTEQSAESAAEQSDDYSADFSADYSAEFSAVVGEHTAPENDTEDDVEAGVSAVGEDDDFVIVPVAEAFEKAESKKTDDEEVKADEDSSEDTNSDEEAAEDGKDSEDGESFGFESLLSYGEDGLSFTDEFNRVFGDAEKSIEEIEKQPLQKAVEPDRKQKEAKADK